MVSESARMSSGAEARFRVQAPNSTPRATKVIALDEIGEAVVRRLAGAGWRHAAFFTVAQREELYDPGDTAPSSTRSVLCDLAGKNTAVTKVADTADLVVLVAGPGGHA